MIWKGKKLHFKGFQVKLKAYIEVFICSSLLSSSVVSFSTTITILPFSPIQSTGGIDIGQNAALRSRMLEGVVHKGLSPVEKKSFGLEFCLDSPLLPSRHIMALHYRTLAKSS